MARIKADADRRGVPYVEVIRLAIDLFFQFAPPLKKLKPPTPYIEDVEDKDEKSC